MEPPVALFFLYYRIIMRVRLNIFAGERERERKETEINNSKTRYDSDAFCKQSVVTRTR